MENKLFYMEVPASLLIGISFVLTVIGMYPYRPRHFTDYVVWIIFGYGNCLCDMKEIMNLYFR